MVVAGEAETWLDAGVSVDQIIANEAGKQTQLASLELAIEMSLVQKFIARRLSVDELFDDTTRALAP